MDTVIGILLPYFPYKLTSYAAQEVECTNRIYDVIPYATHDQTVEESCFLHSASSSTLLDWPTAYAADNDSRIILQALWYYKPNSVPLDIVQSVHMSFRALLKKVNIVLLGNKRLLFKSMSMGSKIISLIIAPTSLRRTFFDHYHIGLSGGHMGEYKTLYQLRMRFFWPSLREEIKKWMAACAHCVNYNIWRTRSSKLHLSCLITVSFWIIYTYLWSPGLTEDINNQKVYLFNSVYDLT